MMIPRPTITTAAGRTYRGIWPQDIRAGRETPYIKALALAVRGVCEVTLPVGRVDVATSTHAYEVEPVGSWRAGARQAYGYAGMADLKPAVALFGAADYLSIYLRIRDRLPGLGLWVWGGRGWESVTSRKAALRMNRSAHPPG